MLDIILLITHAAMLWIIYQLVEKHINAIRKVKQEHDENFLFLQNNLLHITTRFEDIIRRFNELERHVDTLEKSKEQAVLNTVKTIANHDSKIEMDKKNIAMLWRKFNQIKKGKRV